MLRSTHQRVENALDLGEPNRFGEDEVAQHAAIHRVAARGLGKHRRHGRRGRPAGRQQPVHGSVGVVHGHAQAPKQRRRGRLAHAD